MKVPLGSRTNVREVLKFFDVIEATDFITLPEQSRDRQSREIKYHPDRTGCGDD